MPPKLSVTSALRVGEDVVGAEVGMKVAAEGVGVLGAEVGLDAADG